jgi:general secretion pathway protein D
MKLWLVICVLFGCLVSMAPQQPQDKISTSDQKLAEKDFHQAQDLQKSGQMKEALESATAAADRVPGNPKYLTLRELLREQLAAKYLERGNLLAQLGDSAGARAQFQSALALDPANAYVQQRLRDVAPPGPAEEKRVQMLASVDQTEVMPAAGRHSFHLQLDTRALYEQIGKAFAVSVQFDSTLTPRQVRLDVDNVDFQTAMAVAGKVTRTFWASVSNHEAVVANDSPELRLQYERLGLRSFYISPGAATDLNDAATVLRNIFEIRFINVNAAKNIITVRASKEILDAIGSVLDNLLEARPQVLLDVQAYEIDSDQVRNVGLNLPTDFQIFSIPGELRRVLGADAQTIIDQLNRTGTIDPSTIPAGDLGKLQGSPLLAPFIFFGKGLGLTGIGFPGNNGSLAGAQLSRNSSFATSLDNVQLRAMDGEAATFRLGTRVPIVNSSFIGVAVSAKGQPSLGSAVPSFQYEDLGLTLKSTPHYHTGGEVTLDMELTIKNQGATQPDGLPLIISREYKGNITIRDGEAAIVAGYVTFLRTGSGQGLVPGGEISPITNTSTKERMRQEILVVVTPHLVGRPFREAGSDAVWLSH